MARNPHKDPSIKQKNHADSIASSRRMNKRAKTQSNKVDRRILKKDLEEQVEGN